MLLPDHRERAFGFGEDWERSRTGILLPPAATVPTLPIGVDLFAGAGGFSCGFHQAGFHVMAASEWWPVAVATYLCNLGSPDTRVYLGRTAAPDATKKEAKIFEAAGGEFVTAAEFFELMPRVKGQDGERFAPGGGWIAGEGVEAHPCEVFFCCDARDLTGAFILETLGLERGDVGCVFGGPPCQGFSVAGKQDVADPRNTLVFEFARIVCEIQPRSFVMENVPGIVKMKTAEGIPILDALARVMEDGGMGTYDALREVLAGNDDLTGAVRGQGSNRKPKRNDEPEDEEAVEDPQFALEVGV